MTRGSFAVVIDRDSSSPDFVTHQIITSNEILYDMGPKMIWGMRFGREFFEMVESEESFGAFMRDVNEVTETECERFDPDWPHFGFKVSQITSTADQPFVLFDDKVLKSNPWRTVFNYSDYAYVKNLSSSGVYFRDSRYTFEIFRGEYFVAHYGEFLNGKDLHEFYSSHLPLRAFSR